MIASAIRNGPAETMIKVITMTRNRILMMKTMMMIMMSVVCKAGPARVSRTMTKIMMTKIMMTSMADKVTTMTIDRPVLEARAAVPARGGVQDRDLE